jgi:3-hydroxyacyl-CoA dehydrogenase
MSDTLVTMRRDGDVAVVTIANPPVNALGQAVRARLQALADELDADPTVRAVVLTGAGKLFVGGADITEFDRPPEPPLLPELIARIETARKPWIAAVNGMALGGGAEIALGCRYRVAAPAARFALPEVNLGIIPGAGGTQRLPRLIGIQAAIPVVAEGKDIDAARAQALGLVDRVIEGDLVDSAVAFAREVLQRDLPLPAAARDLTDPGADFWAAAEARVAKGARGAAAPVKALAALRFGVENGFAAGLAQERETFVALRASPEAAALRHLFFADRAAPRPAALRGVEPRPFDVIGVVGGGTMGVGIAAAARNAGLSVILSERDEESLGQAMKRLQAIFDAQVKRGLHDTEAAAARLNGVTGIIGLGDMAGCDLVIEAVFEELAIKREVFDRLGHICRADTVLATNTSYLDPEAIFAGLPNPERCLALHFFSPAQVMKLLEIVPIGATAPDTLATGFALARALGKVPVRAGNCEGFIGNRILKRYRAEAEAMVREGIGPAAIDSALRAFGFAMGPFEMQDMAGLDVSFRVREAARARGENVPETLGDMLVRAGRLGQKAGGGWYDYEPGNRKPLPSPAATAILAPECAPPREASAEEIVDRLISTMAAEGRAILDEGIADSPAAIDLVEVHGYGFPRLKGGPMFFTQAKTRQEP